MESKRSKYVLIGLSIFCILLIAVTSFVDGFLNPLRTGIGFFLNPIQSGVNRAGTALYNGVSNYSNLKNAMEEQQALQAEIDRLLEENNRLQSEVFELSRLRELYDLDQDYMQYEKIGARVIAKDSGDWFQVFRINKGSADGVRVDANVIAGGGLVGIVTDVGAHYATVRSIIDDVSRVSGMAQQSGDSCIVAGDLTLFEEGRLRITNIADQGDIKNGDRIVTSNISSKFLPGILIGYATDITVDSTRLTKSGYLVPVAQFDTLQEVLVITQLKEDLEAEGADAAQTGTGESGAPEDGTAEPGTGEQEPSGTGTEADPDGTADGEGTPIEETSAEGNASDETSVSETSADGPDTDGTAGETGPSESGPEGETEEAGDDVPEVRIGDGGMEP